MITAMEEIELVKNQSILNRMLGNENVLVDGKKLLPVSLSPQLMSYDRYKNLSGLCENILNAIEKILRLYIEHTEVQYLFPELAKYRALSLIKPDYPRWVHLARFDIVENPSGEFKLLETNCDCPGAIMFTPIVKNIYRNLDVYDSINAYELYTQPIDKTSFFVESLIDVYRQTRGSSNPDIAFLSSRYKPITSDMNLLEKIGLDLGLNCKHLAVQDLQVINNSTCFNKHQLDLCYQKFDAFIDSDDQAKPCIYDQSPAEVSAYWQGLLNKQMLTFNSFPSSLVAENKRILALLLKQEFQSCFTREEKDAIDKLCPETFSLSSHSSESKNRLEKIISHKDNYVIKRVIDTRGRGVWLGRELTDETWQKLVNSIVDKPYIVQEFIPHKPVSVYSAAEQPVKTAMFSNLALFMINGKSAGMLSRSSSELITNVGRSGCIRPVYIYTNKGKKNDT